MQPFRIRSNDKITQGFTNAELEFAFYRSPPPGFLDICYPELKLSTNEAQFVAFCLSSKTHPTHPRNPGFLGKWSLGHLLPSLPRGPQQKPPCRTCAELEFRDYGALKHPRNNQNSSSAKMKPGLEHAPKLLFPPRQSESPKSLEKVELSKCTALDSMIPSIHSPLHILFYLIGVKTYSHLLSIS